MKRCAFTRVVVLCALATGCNSGSGDENDQTADPTEDAGAAKRDAASPTTGDSGSIVKDAGTQDSSSIARDGGTPDSSSVEGDAAVTDAATTTAPDAGGALGAPTSLTGTLGALGAIQPIVSSLVISNSGETLIYMTTAPLSCDQLMVSRWLGAFTKDAQVVEIVVSGAAKLGSAKNPEVNYAAGGKSSAYEKNAKTASVTFTRAEAMGVVEGTVTSTYSNPTGDVTGHFHAEFCPNGQGY